MDKIKVKPEEFNRIVAERKHKEMLSAISNIKIPESKDNSELISKMEAAIKLLTAKLEVLQSPKVVVEKTEVNQKETVNLLKELIVEIKALKVKEVKEKKEWTFDVIRDINGNIQSVKVKQ